MVLKNDAKRLGVFIFFDKDNIIDDYVLYMLDSLNDAVDKILFVSNSKLSEKELSKLKKYNIDINVRDNIGLDAGAFKYVYDKYGSELFSSYDEVILLNDTFFGPFKPFKNIINEMAAKDIDFWGLTANYDSKDGTGTAIDGFIHSHIQTYFVAYRKTILESEFYKRYWTNYNINKNKSFEDVVNHHESYFTYLLEKEGFKWDTYLNLEHYKKDFKKYNYNIYGYSAYTLLKYYNCPFIKRKNFVFLRVDALYLNDGMDTKRALEYIKNNTNYDVNLIYKNIKRIYKPHDLYQGLNLNFIVHENNKKSKNVAIIANIHDEDSYKYSLEYFERINCDKLIFTNNIELSEKYDIKYTTNLYKNLRNDKNKLVKEYDYICLLNLNDESNNFQEVADSKLIRTLDNTIFNDKYVNGIINIFENDFVDMLFTPPAINNKNIMNITGKIKNDKLMDVMSRNDIKLSQDDFSKSCDSVWIKSNILNNMPNIDIDFEEYLCLFEILHNDVYGKIYNEMYLESDILNMETICKYSMYANKIKMSFPNLMPINDNSNLFRRIFRKYIPLSFRRKLKKGLSLKNEGKYYD